MVSKQKPKSALVQQHTKPSTTQQQPKSFYKKTSIDKFKAKHNDSLKKVAHKTIDKKNKHNQQNKPNSIGMSDERLKAFGINPKKFKKKQKYGAQSNQQNAGGSHIKGAAQLKHQQKIKNKLKKALQK